MKISIYLSFLCLSLIILGSCTLENEKINTAVDPDITTAYSECNTQNDDTTAQKGNTICYPVAFWTTQCSRVCFWFGACTDICIPVLNWRTECVWIN